MDRRRDCDKSRAGVGIVFAILLQFIEAATSNATGACITQLDTPSLSELKEIILAWPKLLRELRTAMLAMTRSATK